MDWIKQYDLNDINDLIIFGVGKGEAYEALKGWLHEKNNRILIFVEEDPNVAIELLKSEKGVALLSDYLVEIHRLSDKLYSQLMWLCFEKKQLIICDPRSNQKSFLKFKATLLEYMDKMVWIGQEYKTYSLNFYYNFYQNLLILPQAYEGVDLYGKANNIPAVIVGAGPSLNKNGHMLHEIQKRGLIFGGGSSLFALKHLGIKPDFGAGIDPNILESQRVEPYATIDCPFFFCSRMNAQALKLIQGDKIFIPGSLGNDTVSYLLDRLNIKKPPFEDGLSVIHFMTEIAVKMGCNPIIYVGLDLAYTEGSSYSDGVDHIKYTPDNALEVPDIFRNKVLTRPLWIQESRWLSNYIKKHPDIRFINSTEGGIGIEGVDNIPFEKVLAQEFKSTIPQFTLKKLNIDLKEIKKEVMTLKNSLQRLLPLIEDIRQFYERLTLDQLNKENLALPEEASWKFRLEQEVAYKAIVKRFEVFSCLIIEHSHLYYLIKRDGLSKQMAAVLVRYHLQKVEFLKQVVLGQLELIKLFYETDSI